MLFLSLRRLMPLILVLFPVAFTTMSVLAQDQPGASESKQSKQRLTLMEETIAGFETSSEGKLSTAALTFVATPLLRYSDPTRGTTEANVLLDATVWRLGEKGRPTALVTLEIYRATEDKTILAYEFLSFSTARFSLAHKQHPKVKWESAGDSFKMTSLGDGPKPAATPAARLIQMRQLVRGFTAKENVKDEDIQCRMLTQPIDRYQAAKDGILDGALFVFANGTNPEIGVLLECGETGWSYGAARLSAAECKLEYNGKGVANFPKGNFELHGPAGYASTNHPISSVK